MALQEYKCPCCGGAIAFDPHLQKLKCPYCDTEFEPEALLGYDEDLKNEGTDNLEWHTDSQSQWTAHEEDSLRSYVCNSCGGEIICDENTAATSCPFCDNPVIMMQQLKGQLKPDYVIPFKLDKKQAKEGLYSHLKGKFLLPKVFKDLNHIDEIKGIYVPFWLFDADADADLRYKGTKTRFWSDANYNYTETSYFSVYRAGNLGFNHVPVDGSSKMPDDLMESVEPFDFSEAVPFQTAYLAGYLADKYDVNAEQSSQRANTRVKESTEQAFRGTIQGYATLTPEANSVRLYNGKTQYALYPVWILNTTYKDEKYMFAMNGQTGKFVGNLPTDWGKFWSTALLLTAGIGAVVYGIQWLLQLLQIL
ncbi:MAG: hypothetical protein IJJ15_05890 [Ruminococcus sp.]|nr:hypothetical protein [Ruminococcus sp.]